jgi:3-oxoadipate enol-lactonase
LQAWVQRKDPSESLSNVKCPSLVLVGTEDVFAGIAKAELVQQAIPGAQLLAIGNSGHVTLQEQAASVTLALTHIVQLGSYSAE